MNNARNTTEIMNQLKDVFSADVSNLCSSFSSALNKKTVNLCGIFNNDERIFNQDALVNSAASCINSAVIKKWTSTEVLNDLAQKTDQALSSTQQGLDIGKIFMWIGIIVGLFLLLAIIGVIIYFFFLMPKGSSKTTIISVPAVVKT